MVGLGKVERVVVGRFLEFPSLPSHLRHDRCLVLTFCVTLFFLVFIRVKSGDFEIPSHVSPLARDLIRQLLRKSPSDRLPLDRVLTHPFFSDAGSAKDDDVFSSHSRLHVGRTATSSASATVQTLGSDGSSGKGSQVRIFLC